MSDSISVRAFQSELDQWIDRVPDGAVVFDADGTLWSHDVGCMVFDFALQERQFRDEAAEALLSHLSLEGLAAPAGCSANELARVLQKAFYAGKTGERRTAEMQVWAYAGHSLTSFRSLVRAALDAGRHLDTLHLPLFDLANHARDRGLSVYIVSASPLWVVQESTRGLGFGDHEIAGGVPEVVLAGSEVLITPRMAAPLPYGADKVVAGRRLLAGRPWLAALGDSAFDVEMMKEAKLAGVLGNKPELAQRLSGVPQARRLTSASYLVQNKKIQ